MGRSGGSSGGVEGVAVHPAAVVVVKVRWRPNPEPGAGFAPLREQE